MYNEREYWSKRLQTHGAVNTSLNDCVNPLEHDLLIKYIKQGDVIIDYGVGGGRLFSCYNEIKPIVQGWDIADFRKLLDEKKHNYPDFTFHHYYSEKNDLWNMEYPDENFKVLVSFSVLTHIKPINIEKTIAEMMRISKVAIISAYDDEPLAITEDNYCFLHDYNKLFDKYKIIEKHKLGKLTYFVIQK